MHNIYYPNNKNDNIYIAVLSKESNVNPKDITLEYRDNQEKTFFNTIGFDINKAIFMNQVHKDNIVKIDETNINSFGSREKLVKETDAIITNLKNIPLVVQTAD